MSEFVGHVDGSFNHELFTALFWEGFRNELTNEKAQKYFKLTKTSLPVIGRPGAVLNNIGCNRY